MREIRQKYYFPSIANRVRKWVKTCRICVQDERIENSQHTPELISIPECDLGPAKVMQIDLLLELPPSGGHENIITAIDVFSRYVFVYPVSSPRAVNKARVIIDIMTRHAYFPTVIITDKVAVLFSNVINEKTDVLAITLRHSPTKYAQTIGLLGRKPATIKT